MPVWRCRCTCGFFFSLQRMEVRQTPAPPPQAIGGATAAIRVGAVLPVPQRQCRSAIGASLRERATHNAYLLPGLLENTRVGEAPGDSAWSVAPQKRQNTEVRALRSSLIFKKKRLVFCSCKPILNGINDDAGKGSSSTLFPSSLHSLC
jgi:hypothetical protein